MAVSKKLVIDDKEVEFRASAAIPRLYRIKFRRDIYRDLMQLEKNLKQVEDAEKDYMDTFSLELFENISYIMAKHADSTIPDKVEEWLDGFNTFSIYQVLPEIIELWGLNMETDIKTKKNSVPPNVK